MGWVWRDEPDDAVQSTARNDDRCSTRKVVRSQCKTEEVEPGKFIRKCEKTEELLRDCLGKPTEVLQSNKEYTEDDVTNQLLEGNFSSGSLEKSPFEFPGLHSDIEAIERHFLGGINRFFDAAEEMKNSLFDAFGGFYGREPPSFPERRQGTDNEGHPQMEAPLKQEESGYVDLSGMARDV